MRSTHDGYVKDDLGQVLDYWLKQTGTTDAELASFLGLDPSAVSHWRGRRNYPNLTNLARMAEFFGVDVSTFLKPRTRQAG